MDKIILKANQETKMEKFFKDHYFSRNFFIDAYREKRLKINGNIAGRNTKVKSGDILEIYFNEEDNGYKPENLALPIIYEDENLLIVNKSAGINTIGEEGSLTNYVSYLYQQRNIHRKVRILGRLDRDTSGLVVICKNPLIQGYFSHPQIRKQLKKYYTAYCHGKMKPMTIDLPILRKGIRSTIDPKGKTAMTKILNVEEIGPYSKLFIEIPTGRTHQIRVHLSAMGHPLLGDPLYGKEDGFQHQALTATKICWRDIQGQRREVEINAPLPKEKNSSEEKNSV
ncbi:MAG: RluA family pseudouridine synthase [Tissierellia bacterium]|nr:RluA family pseudouridine synthase [Tissierellia bacterium]